MNEQKMSLSSNLRTSPPLSPADKRLPHRQHPPNPNPHPNGEYTRHAIHRVSSLVVRRPPAPHLPPLSSIRWDSHLVCKLLKTHPAPQGLALLPLVLHPPRLPPQPLHLHHHARTPRRGRPHRLHGVPPPRDGRTRVLPDARHLHCRDALEGRGWAMEGAERAWREMRERGLAPTLVSYTAYMKAHLDRGTAKEAMEVYVEMVAAGIRPSCHTYTVIMGHLAGADTDGDWSAVWFRCNNQLNSVTRSNNHCCYENSLSWSTLN